MPKLITSPSTYIQAEDAAFLASINESITRANNRSKRENKASKDNASPAYWKRQRDNMQSDVGSWDQLTSWIV